MNLADCYRLLGLRVGASFEEIKASYRRLARQYHPDVNPDSDQQSKDKFIQLTEAYKFLISVLSSSETMGATDLQSAPAAPESVKPTTPADVKPPSSPQVKVTRKPPAVQRLPDLSDEELKLKQSSYEQLQLLLRGRRFPRAIALVEGLAQRLPKDPEVRQWQAIAYQRWGRHLLDKKDLEKARIYLKKALKTDPHNRSLWLEVERDFRRMEKIF